ncbi:hypothetical protein QE382_002171 [Sphingobacterium zeae]|uniref:Uncharacterized protein n=1 Tax=Sphingobacterium zeae TaxID=1776859 RepID=A0ABU0U5E3_9SPHI|nr:hypothetical protein [Sphingobacterium zeae]MDQ1150187.1 hypothetical protein [Sphingobacterium zeae]
MATLLIIASMALNVALTAIIMIFRKGNQRKHTQFACKESKRNIQGRLMVPYSDLNSKSLTLISSAELSQGRSTMPKVVTDQVVGCVTEAIKEELESKPESINIQVARDSNFKRVVVDFDFDLILKSEANVRPNLNKPRIINTHF